MQTCHIYSRKRKKPPLYQVFADHYFTVRGSYVTFAAVFPGFLLTSARCFVYEFSSKCTKINLTLKPTYLP